jgi:thiol-disulfide isomerase/thioredoxin
MADAAKQDGAYYYAQGGVSHGPLDQARMIELAQRGELRASARVWTEALPAGMRASRVPFLAPHLARSAGIGPRLGLALGVTTGAIGLGLLGAFLWMVPAAAAREAVSACRGLAGVESHHPEICPEGQESCRLPVPAPDFTAIDHEGKPVKLSDFRGKVVLLNFWASWCETCKAEKASLAKLANDLAGKDFEVISLASDSEWSKVLLSTVRALRPLAKLPLAGEAGVSYQAAQELYQRELPAGVPFKVFLDPPKGDDTIGVIARNWGLSKVPESVLIDRRGMVRAYFVNKRDWSSAVAQTCVRSTINELIDEAPAR